MRRCGIGAVELSPEAELYCAIFIFKKCHVDVNT